MTRLLDREPVEVDGPTVRARRRRFACGDPRVRTVYSASLSGRGTVLRYSDTRVCNLAVNNFCSRALAMRQQQGQRLCMVIWSLPVALAPWRVALSARATDTVTVAFVFYTCL